METGLPIWQAPDDLQEMLLEAWRERRKANAQADIEAKTAAALGKR